ncbi:hypothetical protein BUE76_01355 [Cnuella takakiae]|nr:hypothetical protein BUE76_01355 [Cnuella takakiae]
MLPGSCRVVACAFCIKGYKKHQGVNTQEMKQVLQAFDHLDDPHTVPPLAWARLASSPAGEELLMLYKP